jgi:hypothetical protein
MTHYIRWNNSGTLVNPAKRARRKAIKAAGGIRQFKRQEKLRRALEQDATDPRRFSGAYGGRLV